MIEKSNVKFVGTATIGFEHIDIDYLSARKIGFESAPGSNANSVAEYVIAGLLELVDEFAIELEGKSIGIIGVGNVGSRLAKKCNALGMKLYLNDPPLFRQTGDKKYLPLEELFDCDIITLHTPLTFEGIDKTFHLADEKFFNSLKSGCIFVNTARGGVVETEALKEAIQTGKIKASILDVWENEPEIDIDFLKIVNIATPHIAGYSFDGKIAGMIMIYKSCCEYFDIEPVKCIEDFLPRAHVPVIEISDEDKSESILRNIVRSVYDVKSDDLALRKLLEIPIEERGFFFDKLRKEYPQI